MAGMKRFVTYIYAYEDGKKGSNAGFAKIEIRGTDCRIEIHLRGDYAWRAPGRICLFRKAGEWMEGVAVGEIRPVNGGGNFAAIVKADRIGNSPFGIGDMEGIFIHSEDDRIFMSRWKEGEPLEVSRNRFREWKPEEAATEKNALSGETGPEKPEAEKAAAGETRSKSGSMKEAAPDGHVVRGMAPGEHVVREVAAGESRPGAGNMQKTQEIGTFQRNRTNIRQNTGLNDQNGTERNGSVPTDENVAENRQDGNTSSQNMAQEPEKARPLQEVSDRQPVPGRQPVPEQQPERTTETVRATEIPMRNILPGYDWQTIWENLTSGHPQFTPFEDQEAVCIQLELRELRDLPRRYWYLGNNSFLLHGFFNYRYFVLGRTGEGRWFLGVPGIYQRQERVMAAIFGFPEFIPTAAKEDGDEAGEPVNRFGCWYRYIEE